MIIKKNILFFVLILLTANSHALFIHIIPLYNEKKQERIDEYLYCIKKNLAHKLIDKIHIIYDTTKDDKTNNLLKQLKKFNKKVKISYVKKWQTYKMCIDLANKLYPKKAIIISNADIYFDKTLNLLKNYDLNNKLLSLTRWNQSKEGNITLCKSSEGIVSIWSNDAWIYKNPIKSFKSNIRIGTPGCDSAINYYANKAGIKVINPCLSIKCIHVHNSNVHNHSEKDRNKGPYLYIKATKLE
jgi:hypothetical protein